MTRLQRLKAQRTRLENRACSLIFKIEHPDTPESALTSLEAELLAVDAEHEALSAEIAAEVRAQLQVAA